MGAEQLKQALDDCIINFDRQVLVTDLLQDYQMPYADVDKILKTHLAEEEKKGTKFEKRFMVSGEDEATNNEIYTVVKGETKLKEWLRKLKNAESALYSIEIVGGAKTPASIFKPMKWCAIRLENTEKRTPLKWGNTSNGDSSHVNVKTETAKPKGLNFAANTKKQAPPAVSNDKSSEIKNDTKKSPTKVKNEEPKQATPEEQKTNNVAKVNSKKGIASFFGPAKTEDKTTKKASGVVKPPTPKKMQDFFKKSDKPSNIPKSIKDEKPNTSVQLFDDEEDEMDDKPVEVEEVESDEEAQLDAIRKECSEKMEESNEVLNDNASKKRRRIIDSDDEDSDKDAPQPKQEKKAKNEEEKQNNSQSETFLDEDGFVLTVRGKNNASSKKPVKAATPEKSPIKRSDTKKPPKASPITAKTKQGNIMNFFSKK